MKTSGTAEEIARTLYDGLVGTALKQVRLASEELADISSKDMPKIQKRIESLLPAPNAPDAMPHVRNLLLALAQEGELGRLPDIVQALENYSGISDIVEAEITSSVPLDEDQRNRIVSHLRQSYTMQLEFNFKVDESLIGGLIIRIGDQVFDNSLRTRLGVVQRSMLMS